MGRVRWPLAILVLVLAVSAPLPALADGIIVSDPPVPCPPCRGSDCPVAPEPPVCPMQDCGCPSPYTPLVVESLRVAVTVEAQVAVTRVEQVLRNDGPDVVEGVFYFPLPADAAVTDFRLWMDGEPVAGEVLSRDQARQKYEEIVRRLQDPALLEYFDRGALQASLFPIPPGESRRLEWEYAEALTAAGGLVRYIYPLSTARFSAAPLEQVSISVRVASIEPVRAIYSPSHSIAVERKDDRTFAASYEESDVLPDRDFALYYSLSEEPISAHLLSHRDPAADEDGFFLLLLAPAFEADADRIVARDIHLILDTSGSMEGEKFQQALVAAEYVLSHLNPADQFSLLAFSSGIRTFSDGLRPAADAREARRWLDGLSASGATDIHRALLETLAVTDPERPTVVLFLTDGLPTEGVTERERILEAVQEAAPASLRMFPFGVGYDVDTFLLDALAEQHHGASTYVLPGEAIDETVSAFYGRIRAPVLTDLELNFGRARVYDVFPDPLPDLFAGGQLALVGRYRTPGRTEVRLTGDLSVREETFVYDDLVFVEKGGPSFLAQLWATRKIGELLDRIRLDGPNPEVVEQIVRLSIRFGIVTPYTSYLVTEPDALGAQAQADIAAEAYADLQATPAQAAGREAVERAAAAGALGAAEIPQALPAEVREVIRFAGGRTFRFLEGVWVDTSFDPDTTRVREVAFLSAEYFVLAETGPEAAAALALGTNVILVQGDNAIRVVGPEGLDGAESVPGESPAIGDDPSGTGPAPGGSLPGTRSPQLPCAGLPVVVFALSFARRRRI